ncbi:hypothetical protein [Lawsonibacter celer]|jgi:hypothetical protein|uniref:hypothetical protein n=1 Tax=Lawsonibacter celer TaxID=2986526 RepID=UPI0016478B52|nr:hypothetical protein [Lawsonibacter celer]
MKKRYEVSMALSAVGIFLMLGGIIYSLVFQIGRDIIPLYIILLVGLIANYVSVHSKSK